MFSIDHTPNFKARYFAYNKSMTNPQVFKIFKEKTAKYPNLILKQNKISPFKDDTFLLIDQNNKVIRIETAPFTNRRPEKPKDIVHRLVSIFNKLLHSPKPWLGEKYRYSEEYLKTLDRQKIPTIF